MTDYAGSVHATESQMAYDWVRAIADLEPDYWVEEPDRFED